MVSKRRQSGQQVYVVLLVITCVFLGVAITFPTYEYISRKYWEKPPAITVPTPAFNVDDLQKTGTPDGGAAPTTTPAGG